MNDDRTYYRMLPDGELIRLASTAPTELALVLAERLTELSDLEQAHDQFIVELENKRDGEAETLLQEIDALKATIAALTAPDEDLTVFDGPEDAYKDAPINLRGSYTDADHD